MLEHKIIPKSWHEWRHSMCRNPDALLMIALWEIVRRVTKDDGKTLSLIESNLIPQIMRWNSIIVLGLTDDHSNVYPASRLKSDETDGNSFRDPHEFTYWQKMDGWTEWGMDELLIHCEKLCNRKDCPERLFKRLFGVSSIGLHNFVFLFFFGFFAVIFWDEIVTVIQYPPLNNTAASYVNQ